VATRPEQMPQDLGLFSSDRRCGRDQRLLNQGHVRWKRALKS